LSIDPYSGKPLIANFKGYQHYLLDDYQIIYHIEETTVLIIKVRHQQDIYNEFM